MTGFFSLMILLVNKAVTVTRNSPQRTEKTREQKTESIHNSSLPSFLSKDPYIGVLLFYHVKPFEFVKHIPFSLVFSSVE